MRNENKNTTYRGKFKMKTFVFGDPTKICLGRIRFKFCRYLGQDLQLEMRAHFFWELEQSRLEELNVI